MILLSLYSIYDQRQCVGKGNKTSPMSVGVTCVIPHTKTGKNYTLYYCFLTRGDKMSVLISHTNKNKMSNL